MRSKYKLNESQSLEYKTKQIGPLNVSKFYSGTPTMSKKTSGEYSSRIFHDNIVKRPPLSTISKEPKKSQLSSNNDTHLFLKGTNKKPSYPNSSKILSLPLSSKPILPSSQYFIPKHQEHVFLSPNKKTIAATLQQQEQHMPVLNKKKLSQPLLSKFQQDSNKTSSTNFQVEELDAMNTGVIVDDPLLFDHNELSNTEKDVYDNLLTIMTDMETREQILKKNSNHLLNKNDSLNKTTSYFNHDPIRHLLKDVNLLPDHFLGHLPSPPYFSLSTKVNHLPFHHLFTAPFDITQSAVCEVIGPSLVTGVISHPVADMSALEVNDSFPSHINPESKELYNSLPFSNNKSDSKYLNMQTRQHIKPRLVNTSDDLLKQSKQSSLRDIVSIQASEYILKKESMKLLYVASDMFVRNSQQLLGELPPTLSSVFLTAWNMMIIQGKEQLISIVGNHELESSVTQKNSVSSLLTSALYFGGFPSETRTNQIDLLKSALQVMRSFSSIRISSALSNRALTRWSLQFNSNGDLKGIKLTSRLIDSLHSGGVTVQSQFCRQCPPAIFTKNNPSSLTTMDSVFGAKVFLSIEMSLELLYSSSPRLRAYTILDSGRSYEISEKQQTSLRYWLRPLWNALGGGTGDISYLSTAHNIEEDEVMSWIRAIHILGITETQIHCIIRHSLAAALLATPVYINYQPSDSPINDTASSVFHSKHELLAALLGVPINTLQTILGAGCQLFQLGMHPAHVGLHLSEEDIERLVNCRFASFIQRQLYGWICRLIDVRFQGLTPHPQSISEETNEFNLPHCIYILDPPSNIELHTDRSFGSLACVLSQSLVEAQAFLRVSQMRFFLNSQGIQLKYPLHCLSGNESPTSDHVVASCLRKQGLFSFGAWEPHSISDFAQYFEDILNSNNDEDIRIRCGKNVFVHLDLTHDNETVSIRFTETHSAFQWSLACLEDAGYSHTELSALFQLVLAKGSLSRILRWQHALECTSVSLNEFDRVLEAIADVVQPILSVPSIVVLRGSRTEDIHRLDKCTSSLRACVAWEKNGLPVWLPLDEFCSQFSILIDYCYATDESISDDITMFLINLNHLTPDGYMTITPDQFVCGISGLMLKIELYRTLHLLQNYIKNDMGIKSQVVGTSTITKQIQSNKSFQKKTKNGEKIISHLQKQQTNHISEQLNPSHHDLIHVEDAMNEQFLSNSSDNSISEQSETLNEYQNNLINNTMLEEMSNLPKNIPWRTKLKNENKTMPTAEQVRDMLLTHTPISKDTENLLQLSDEALINMFSPQWQQVSVRGAWRGIVYCSKKASADLDKIKEFQTKIGSRPAAKNAAETMKNFVAGFCEPLLGSKDAAVRFLVCSSDEDFASVVKSHNDTAFKKQINIEADAQMTAIGGSSDDFTLTGPVQLRVKADGLESNEHQFNYPRNRCLERLEEANIRDEEMKVTRLQDTHNETTDNVEEMQQNENE